MRVEWFNPTVIAASIAFVGTVAAFLVRQHFERESVNRAVLAEISRLLRVVELAEVFWRGRVEANDTQHPLIPFSHVVYTKQVQNIGVLKASIVADAVQFYGYIDFLNALQASRTEYIANGKSADFNQIYLQSLQNGMQQFGHVFDEQFRSMKVT
jgi:hypothetical protein